MTAMCAFGMRQCCSNATLFMPENVLCSCGTLSLSTRPFLADRLPAPTTSPPRPNYRFCRMSFLKFSCLVIFWFVLLALFYYALTVVESTMVIVIVCTGRLFVIFLYPVLSLFAWWNFCISFAIWRRRCEDVILSAFRSNLYLLFIMRRRPMQLFAAQRLLSSLASFLALLQSFLLSFDLISGYLRLYPRLVGVTDHLLVTSKKWVPHSPLSTFHKSKFEWNARRVTSTQKHFQ